jgi:hypothetical protein
MLERRFGKEYERVRKSGRDNLLRARSNTTRYDFFFEAVQDDRSTRLAHAGRGKTQLTAEKEIRRDYLTRGYELENLQVETILDSIK